MKRSSSVLCRPGSDLLFQALRLSTIGAGEFNGRVRDGIGYLLPARTTRPAKDGGRRSDVARQMSDDRRCEDGKEFRAALKLREASCSLPDD